MRAPGATSSSIDAGVLGALRAAAWAFAAVSAILGLAVLLGWTLHNGTLKSVLPGFVSMNPLTALLCILCAAGVACQLRAHGASARSLGLAVVILAGLTLLGIAGQISLHLDKLLFAQQARAEANRMAPQTALGFALVGLSLAWSGRSRRRGPRICEVFALAAASIAMLALIGYAYSVHQLYGVGAYIPMALHTAAALLLLSLAVLFADADRGMMAVIAAEGPAGAMARRLVPAAALVPPLLGMISIGAIQRRWLTPQWGFLLVVLASTLIFVWVLWWEAGLLWRAQEQLKSTNKLLEQTAQSERQAHEALKQTQSQLVQSEKLAGLGQMVAGVAHEINNPLAFVSNNVAVLQRDVAAICEILDLHLQAEKSAQPDRQAILARANETAQRVDLTYVLSNLPQILSRSREGLRRIQQIVKDLRDFARLDESVVQEADLNAGITSTINIIAGYAKKKGVSIEAALNPLPPVRCHPAKLNQVVMNLLTNAIDASREGSAVRIGTESEGDTVSVIVSDCGCGIEPSIRDRIFDPFFTTKPPGQGTGLGLSISYGIIRDHGGQIAVQSTVGQGSCFTMTLPRQGRVDHSPARKGESG